MALLAIGVTASATALIMFVFAAFVVGVLGQELWRGVGARRAMTSEGPARAVVSLVRRNRRRYGGYTVHLGMAVLFVGVAASSAFQHARDVRLTPGQTATVGGYQVTYVRSTARVDERDGGVERVALGADLRVRKDGSKVADLHTERGYYPSSAPFASGGLVRGLFEGEATSEVGMKAGPLRDVWTVIQPDPEYLNKVIAGVADRTADKPVAQQEKAVGGLMAVYQRGVIPAQFRLLVSPLVAWIWIGGLIVFAGGLIALWPAPDAARGRARAGYAARVAQDLDRASDGDRRPPRRLYASAACAPPNRPSVAARRRRAAGRPGPLIVIVLLGVVVWLPPARRPEEAEAARRDDLEAAKEAKYREIRDAELDYRTGKLSEEDWRALDRELRGEAMDLLRRLDELG